MQREDIERLREQVSCAVGLERAGFTVDLKESTRRAIKYRRGAEIIIVTHEGRGWFDPLSDRKGDIFALIGWLQARDFPSALAAVGDLAGLKPTQPQWQPIGRRREHGDIGARWLARPLLIQGSTAHDYLAHIRAIPRDSLRRAISAKLIRQGPSGNAWFAHQDSAGRICGWEERGLHWRRFSSGGTKTLFTFGNPAGPRLCITEAAIDALSLLALDGRFADTLYASTAGGWSPSTEGLLLRHAERLDVVVAATDRDCQGEAYADKLRWIALKADRGFQRLRPLGEDWNDDLRQRREKEE